MAFLFLRLGSFFNPDTNIAYFVQRIVAHVLFYFKFVGAFCGEFKIGDQRNLVAIQITRSLSVPFTIFISQRYFETCKPL